MTDTPLDSTQETRSRILEAAVSVFASKGYHDTKVDDIVSQSQTSKGSFYFYFPSKQDIFMALVDTFADLLESRLRERLSTEPSGTARVNAALRVCLETFGQYRSLAKIALVQATGLGAAFEQKRQAVNQRFIEIVRENLDSAVADGGTATSDCARVALKRIRPSDDPMKYATIVELLQSVGIPEERIRQLEEQ